MRSHADRSLIALEPDHTLWEHVLMPAPLAVIGTRDQDGTGNLAPRHQIMTMGRGPHIGFVVSPAHRTYQNVMARDGFTVSFTRPEYLAHAALAASGRDGETGERVALAALPTFEAQAVDAPLLDGGSLYLECLFDRVVEDLGLDVLVIGRVIRAWAHEDVYLPDGFETSHDPVQDAPVLAYLHPGRFAIVEASHAFPYPLGFSR